MESYVGGRDVMQQSRFPARSSVTSLCGSVCVCVCAHENANYTPQNLHTMNFHKWPNRFSFPFFSSSSSPWPSPSHFQGANWKCVEL